MPCGVERIPEPREWRLTKRCARCTEVKPWAKFSPGRYWPDGSVRWVQSYCKACHAEINRNRPKKPITPERLQYVVEHRRRRRAAMREERTSGGVRLPSRPIAELIVAARDEMDAPDMQLLGYQCGVNDRILRRLMVQEHVTLRLADQICTRLGRRIYDLYPELEEVAA